MDRIGNIFIEIKTQINYIINDSDFTYYLINRMKI